MATRRNLKSPVARVVKRKPKRTSTSATRFDAVALASTLADPGVFATPEALVHGAKMIDDYVLHGKLPLLPTEATRPNVIRLAARDGREVIEFEPEFDREGA